MIKFTRKSKQKDLLPATTLTLTWEKRIKSRQRVQLDNKDEAGLFLERGETLKDGDFIISEDKKTTVKVIAAIENVSTIYCSDSLHFARTCYHLGNRHVIIEIGSNYIRYLHDHVVDDMVRAMGLKPVTEQAAFEPESGAYNHKHAHE